MLLADISTFDGIAAHPLIVHLPVVLVPLAAVGAVAALVRPGWRSWCLPLTAVFAGIGLVGVQLAIMSGEGLEELLDEESAAIERHASIAEQARPIVLLFVLAAVAAAVIWRRSRPHDGDDAAAPAAARTASLARFAVPIMALSVLTGALSTVWIFRTGHSGAESVWKEESGGEGREGGEEREGADHDDDRDREAPTDSDRYEDDDD